MERHIHRYKILILKTKHNPNKNFSRVFGVEIDKLIQKFTLKRKGSRIAKTNFKKNKAGELTLPDSKTYYIASVIKTMVPA